MKQNFRIFFASIVYLLLPWLSVFGHPMGGVPDMVIEVDVKESEIGCELTTPCSILRDEFKFKIPDESDFPASGSAEQITFAESVIGEKKMITVDGIPIKPIVKSIDFSTIPNLFNPAEPPIYIGAIRFTYPSKGLPRQIGLKIEFPGSDPNKGLEPIDFVNMRLTEVVGVIKAEGIRRTVVLKPEEPEFKWHSEKTVPKPVSLIVKETPTVEKWSFSLLWVFVIGGFALGVWLLINKGFSLNLKTLGGAFLFVLGSIIAANTSVEISNPFKASLKPPEAAEALNIFSSLHRNIYRAFDYRKESDIYDTLAISVDGRLLDWIYSEIFQSLVLRTEGGAVCQIQSVNILNQSVLASDKEKLEPGAFRVRCRWKVKGAVEHWGHVHSRTNLYEADYSVAPREKTWKIVDVEILDQKRDVPQENEAAPEKGNKPGESSSSETPRIEDIRADPGGTETEDLSRTASEPLKLPKSTVKPELFTICKEMAEKGFSQFQMQLAEMYFKGEGVQQNKPEAVVWLRKAAEQDNSDAQNLLGVILFTGDGVPKDNREAFRFFQQAAEKGNLEAQYHLGVMYDQGEAVVRDAQEALRWYKKAADRNNVKAQYNLGYMYFHGDGVGKSEQEAIRWFSKAAEKGEPRAQFDLGIIFLKGLGTPQDYSKAFEWFERAAKKGERDAQFNLGVMYSKGLGVQRDISEAQRWYRMAADGGSAEAQEALKQSDSQEEKNPAE